VRFFSCFFDTASLTNFFAAVIDKPVLPPSGDPHDYMSWAP